MIRKYVSVVALSLALISGSSTLAPKAMDTPNENNVKISETEEKEDESRHKPKMGKEHAACDIKMLTCPENMKLLSDEDKKALEEINNCLKENKDLTKDHIKTLMALKDKVAKCKLGDKDYKRFKELMKNEKKGCLKEDEKKELDGYLKKIHCK